MASLCEFSFHQMNQLIRANEFHKRTVFGPLGHREWSYRLCCMSHGDSAGDANAMDVRAALVAWPAPYMSIFCVDGHILVPADVSVATMASPDMAHFLGDELASLQFSPKRVIGE